MTHWVNLTEGTYYYLEIDHQTN
jgi:hypothetical protein